MRRTLLNAMCPPQEWAFTLRLIFIMLPTVPAHPGTFHPCTWAPPSAGLPQLWRRKMKIHPLSARPLRRWRNRRRCTAMCHQRSDLPFFFFFFLRVYLFIWERRHELGQVEGEGEASSPLSREPNTRLDPRGIMNWVEGKSLNWLKYPGVPSENL